MSTPRTLPSSGGTDDDGAAELVASAAPRRTRTAIEPDDAPRRDVPGERSVCRSAVPEDLTRTAAIHAKQLPNGFFVRFGPRFLAAYHGTFLSGPAATALVVGPIGAPTAFLVGTYDNAWHYRWLLRNVGSIVRPGLVALAARPRLAYELLRTRSRRYLRSVIRLSARGRGSSRADGPRSGARTPTAAPVVAVLTHVAVDPQEQGAGLGRTLVEAFVEQAREHAASEVRLIASAATPAPGFYQRLGWICLGERNASDGTLVQEFRLVL